MSNAVFVASGCTEAAKQALAVRGYYELVEQRARLASPGPLSHEAYKELGALHRSMKPILEEVSETFPMVGMLATVESMSASLGEALRRGRYFLEDATRLATRFTDLAEMLRDWFVELDESLLSDVLVPGDPVVDPGPLSGHPVLGYAPLSMDELLRRVRFRLSTDDAHADRQDLDGWRTPDARRHGAAHADGLRVLAWLPSSAIEGPPDASPVLAATYRAYATLLRGYAAFPPLVVLARVRALAAFCSLKLQLPEPAFFSSGHYGMRPSGFVRATIVHGLAQVRAAALEAFPGVADVLQGSRAKSGEPGALARGAIYRRRAVAVEEAPDPYGIAESASSLDNALAHGMMASRMDSELAAGRSAERAEARDLHKRLVTALAQDAYRVIAAAASRQDAFRLAQFACSAFSCLSTAQQQVTNPDSMDHVATARSLLERLRDDVGLISGLGGTSRELVQDAAHGLRFGSPTSVGTHGEFVRAFAERARPARLFEEFEALQTIEAEVVAAARAQNLSPPESLFESLGFVRSEAREARSAADEARLRADFARARVAKITEEVLRSFSAAYVYYGLERVLFAVNQIGRVTSYDVRHYEPLSGCTHAISELSWLTRCLVHAFGPSPSVADRIEALATRDL